MNDVLPAPQIDGGEALFESLDHSIVSCVFDENVALAGVVAECDGLRCTDIFLQVCKHCGAGRAGGVDAHQFLTLFAIEGVEVDPDAGSPGLFHEGSVKSIDVLLLVNDQKIDDVVGDLRIGPHIISIGRDPLFPVEPRHGSIGADGRGVFLVDVLLYGIVMRVFDFLQNELLVILKVDDQEMILDGIDKERNAMFMKIVGDKRDQFWIHLYGPDILHCVEIVEYSAVHRNDRKLQVDI
mgnify:CR=1 FL=1